MRRALVLIGLMVVLAVPASGQEYALPTPSPSPTPTPTCETSTSVRHVRFAKSAFPNLRKHYRVAIRRGWPKTLVLNRKGAAARSAKLLSKLKTKAGYDRDEYPPAIGRGKGRGAKQGHNPRGWVADVGYVRSPEGVVAGLALAVKLAPFCDGTKFRYVFV